MKKRKVLPNWDDVFFNGLIVNNLVQFVSPISLMSLVRAFPKVRTKLSNSVYEIIQAKIRSFFGSRNDVFNTLHENSAITGGSLLCGLLEDDWFESSSDIDIVVYEPPLSVFCDMKKERAWTTAGFESLPCYGSYPHSQHVSSVTNYTSKAHEKVLQVIKIKGSLDEYVSSFDLDFCKVYLKIGKLVVKYPFSVLKKFSTLRIDQQYIPTGMEVPDHFLYETLPKVYKRLEKYVERGFWVTIVKLLTERSVFAFFVKDHVTSELRKFYRSNQFDSKKMQEALTTFCLEPHFISMLDLAELNELIAETLGHSTRAIVQADALHSFKSMAKHWEVFWKYRMDPNTRSLITGMVPKHMTLKHNQFGKKFY
jgi:hypothetical protein